MKNAKFKFYAAGIAFANVSVAVYENKEGNYILQVERNDCKVRGTEVVEISKEEYENLDHDYYNSLVRFRAAAELCGYYI